MTSGITPACESVWEAIVSNPEPLARPPDLARPTVEDIANSADVEVRVAKRCLKRFLEADRLLSISHEGEKLYYPHPTKRYFEQLEKFLERQESEHPAIKKEKIFNDIEDWRPQSEVQSIDDVYEYRMGARLVACSRYPVGFHPYNFEWDVLVILDSCRVDALRQAIGRMDGVEKEDVIARISLGSQTSEWLCQTFTSDHHAEITTTGFVSGNGWVKGVFDDGLRPEDEILDDGDPLPTEWDVVDGDAFGALVNAWREEKHGYSTDAPWGPHPSPRTVTDHAIALGRERPDLERLVVHYKQPHFPYTLSAKADGRTELTKYESSPFDVLANGGRTEPIWNAYLTDLRAAIDEVSVLCNNVNGRVAITADHGEDFDVERRYLHRPTMLHPMVKRVPWVTVSATDERTREGDISSYHTVDRDVNDQLEALGYR